MQTFTTKGATDLLYADDFRSNGCPDVWCLLNESGTIELEATTEEVQSALEELERVGLPMAAPVGASLAGASEFKSTATSSPMRS
jgi:hypothetical protein